MADAQAAMAAAAAAAAEAGEGPAPPLAANVAALAMRIVVPNLRNGDVAAIGQAAPRSSIPDRFKWAHITNMTPADMVPNVDAVIRATYAQLLAGNPDATQPNVMTASRNAAIVIGSIRAGAASAWTLTPADMNREEVVGSGSEFAAVAGSAVGHVDRGAGTAGGNYALATGMTAITPQEVNVINILAYLGMAVPVMQGISLVLTGHHYLPTTKNHFMGMKRQALQAGGEEVTVWIEALGDSFDDWAFHKACHPISPPVKRSWAKNVDVAARMTASGHTAAAIRIPALPSDAQGAKAVLAVMVKAAPVIQGMNHHISWAQGTAAIRAVELAAEGREELDAVAAAKAWVSAHSSQAGFCAGIVRFLADSEGTGQDSTLRAFSVRKIIGDKAADVSKGTTYARAYTQRMREQALDGTFTDPNIVA